MKKAISFILLAVVLLLATVPAFASPACPYCSGHMRNRSYENIRATGEPYEFVEGTAWNPFVQAYTTAWFLHLPCYRDVYFVCDENPSHKEFWKTERFVSITLSGY